ncbi:MAG TPA: NADH-quinone oxidoreductase subunit NuoF [Anaerolineae bacterium]|nr:NADH-quinone oxidoreductase subunit NuoF [Anaerolineae bacterium]
METKPLTARFRADGEAVSLKEYHAAGGYDGLVTALSMHPDSVRKRVEDARLRGRGGAGFPTGLKWSFVPKSAGDKFFIVNADEMEPGTFKDRLLLERDPHQVIEGAAIGAYAVGARTAYIFLRGEYRKAARRLERALAEAYRAGILGQKVMGRDYALDIHLHISGGRYICGEETALLNALEGKRPVPRAKPPFPQSAGLFGCPTVINNAETVCNLPHILRWGPEWYRSLSRCDDGGTKLYGVSGPVKNPGLWELQLGTTAREIIDGCAGGLLPGHSLRAFQPGGASTDFLLPEHLDIPLDYDSVMRAGSRLGTGCLILLDHKTCPVRMVLNLERFFARESCGWCTPCRDGLPYTETVLRDLVAGRGRPEDLDLLAEMIEWMAPGNTFCALAPGAMAPLHSALKHFREDFERYLEADRG